MAEHFLTKSRIDRARCIQVSGVAAIDQYEALYQTVATVAGSDVAKLFAEPLFSRGNDQAAATVSWYSDRPGQGVPLARLEAAEQEAVGAILKERLAPLQALLNDPQSGALIGAALHLAGSGDIWSVDGQPVLVNWGMMPETGTDVASRTAHYRKTLGPFLPLDTAPGLTVGEIQPNPESTTEKVAVAEHATQSVRASAGVSASAASKALEDGGNTEDPPRLRGPVPLLAWLPLLVLLFLFGGVLAWLLTPGNRIFADDAPEPVVADEAALRAARDVNRALESRLAALDEALTGAVCRADGTLLMPDGLTIEGLLPPDLGQGALQGGQIVTADVTPTLPPAPERVMLQGDGALTGDTASLLNHIDARTAMVLVGTAQGMTAGTGFFVGPDLMITNFHVIEQADDDNIFVTNKALGALKRVEVLKRFGPMREVGADFALLRVAGVDQPFYTIRQSDASMRLQSVIAAGYPGDLLRTDSQFKALQDGNIAAVPELTVSDGTVNTEQALSATTHAVVHSAPISTGNSGGPLIDMCGRVVGVNTFVVQGPLRNLNFALATRDLLAFLSDTPAAPAVSDATCAPLVARPNALPLASDR